ncbi:UNVERIFIED_ORG: DUF3079 domain-containing protein [Shinella sp. XGS7]|nr:DUF3079 domain-containing protein [Shinella sp. XGS7]
MSKRFPMTPPKPERVCWGCDLYCRADDMRCGNGSIATSHPSELFGSDWMSWGIDATAEVNAPGSSAPASVGIVSKGQDQGQ